MLPIRTLLNEQNANIWTPLRFLQTQNTCQVATHKTKQNKTNSCEISVFPVNFEASKQDSFICFWLNSGALLLLRKTMLKMAMQNGELIYGFRPIDLHGHYATMYPYHHCCCCCCCCILCLLSILALKLNELFFVRAPFFACQFAFIDSTTWIHSFQLSCMLFCCFFSLIHFFTQSDHFSLVKTK